MDITWINQGGFVVQDGPTRLVVDPYISQSLKHDHLVEPPLELEELAPSAVFITHDHGDHLDSPAIGPLAERFGQCTFMGPAPVIEKLLGLGIEPGRLKEVSEGSLVQLAQDFEIRVTRAIHTTPAVGLVANAGGVRVYISGDSEYEPALAGAVAGQAGGRLDLAAVCINGRWGNMNAAQAAELVKALRPGLAVPMHFGLFAQNTVEPSEFILTCRHAGIGAIVLAPGRTYNVRQLVARHRASAAADSAS